MEGIPDFELHSKIGFEKRELNIFASTNNTRRNRYQYNTPTTTNTNRQYIIDSTIQRPSLFDYITRNSGILDNFLDPIEINPTPTQIEIATRHVRYCDISY